MTNADDIVINRLYCELFNDRFSWNRKDYPKTQRFKIFRYCKKCIQESHRLRGINLWRYSKFMSYLHSFSIYRSKYDCLKTTSERFLSIWLRYAFWVRHYSFWNTKTSGIEYNREVQSVKFFWDDVSLNTMIIVVSSTNGTCESI